jgi:protein-tyrosine phosphatase
MHILVVCSANICRSPAAAQILTSELAQVITPLAVSSAGTEALVGQPACQIMQELIAVDTTNASSPEVSKHRSRQVTKAAVESSDFVIALEHHHLDFLAQLAPQARARNFTLKQASRLADRVARQVGNGKLPDGAPPLPDDSDERLSWLLAEMHEARGQAVLPPESARVEALGWDSDDISDPHVEGLELHPMAADLIQRNVRLIADSLAVVMNSRT